MEVQFSDYGFYQINYDYMRFLYSQDNQVFFAENDNYGRKPYLGVLINLGSKSYCIPLTSAKRRHLTWSNIGKYNLLIYEIVSYENLHTSDIFKPYGNQYKKILSVLDIRKMVPVNENLCHRLNFAEIQDDSYRLLLTKEYRFLLHYKNIIIKKAHKLYKKQKETGVIETCCCNFIRLEQAYDEYILI